MHCCVPRYTSSLTIAAATATAAIYGTWAPPSPSPSPLHRRRRLCHHSRKAEADGADYLYRINDDSELQGAWATTAVSTLRGFNPAVRVYGIGKKESKKSHHGGRD